MTRLFHDADARKSAPMARGLLDYFPNALAEVAALSLKATQQHHPDKPMHWDKNKSTDEADCIVRHLIDRGTLDTDGVRHSAKIAWRALALLQREIEAEQAAISTPPTPEETGCADDCVHPSHRHGRPGRRADDEIRKAPCACRDGGCLVENGTPPKYAYCRKAEDADRAPGEVYAR